MLEKQAIVDALRDSGGNVSRAARKLDVSRRTLQNRMREYGMPVGKSGRPKKRLSYRASSMLGTAAAVAGVSVLVYVAGRRRA